MKRYTTYEEAINQYMEHTGEVPTIKRMDEMYHKYRLDWRHYNGFTDWMINEGI